MQRKSLVLTGIYHNFAAMKVEKVIRYFVFLGVAALLLAGCEGLSHRDSKMEAIAGSYKLSSVELSNEPYPTSSFLSSSQTAEIYEADGQWYFDATYPILNYHGIIEYHKIIFPVTWDQVLCKYLFYHYPSEQDRAGVLDIFYKDGKIQVSIQDFGYFSLYTWSK